MYGNLPCAPSPSHLLQNKTFSNLSWVQKTIGYTLNWHPAFENIHPLWLLAFSTQLNFFLLSLHMSQLNLIYSNFPGCSVPLLSTKLTAETKKKATFSRDGGTPQRLLLPHLPERSQFSLPRHSHFIIHLPAHSRGERTSCPTAIVRETPLLLVFHQYPFIPSEDLLGSILHLTAILFAPLQSLPVKQKNINVLALPLLINSQHILSSRFPFKLLGFVDILVTCWFLQEFNLKEILLYSIK